MNELLEAVAHFLGALTSPLLIVAVAAACWFLRSSGQVRIVAAAAGALLAVFDTLGAGLAWGAFLVALGAGAGLVAAEFALSVVIPLALGCLKAFAWLRLHLLARR
jgi:hypothetical protein